MVFHTKFTRYGHHGNRYAGGLKGRKESVLEDDNLSQEQRATLTKWATERAANQLRELNTIAKLYTLRNLGIFLKEPFEQGMDTEAKAKKLQDYISNNASPYYRKTLRNFYRWLNSGDAPYCVKWLSIKAKSTERKTKPVLSDDEIASMVKACSTQRDKTLLMLLADTGCRVSEILTLKFGNDSQGRESISITKTGAEISVKGKTGERRLTLIDSVPYLTEYINQHPWRGQKGKPLFFASQESNRYGEPLEYYGAKLIIRRAAKIAGIKKKVSSHIFRRSLATKLGKEEKFTIGEVKAQMGWSSIRTADHYLQISSEDVGQKRRAQADGVIVEQQKSEALQPKVCPRCNAVNGAEAAYCKCGMVLDRRTAVKIFEANKDMQEKIESMYDFLAGDPRFRKAFLADLENRKKATSR